MENVKVQMSDVKKEWSRYLREVANGSRITVVKGKQQEPIAEIVPIKKTGKRDLTKGALKVKADFADDWEMTEEELLSL